VLARVQDFDELKTWNTTQTTTRSKKDYVVGVDWDLIRLKDIITIKLMDGANSRKLLYRPPREIDEVLPYPSTLGEQKPSFYTVRGNTIELLPIPDAAYSVYIYHTQWPADLSNDSDQTVFSDDLIDVIVSLAADMVNSFYEKDIQSTRSDWAKRAKELLGIAVKEDTTHPDRKFFARPFDPGTTTYTGEYWKQPFVDKVV